MTKFSKNLLDKIFPKRLVDKDFQKSLFDKEFLKNWSTRNFLKFSSTKNFQHQEIFNICSTRNLEYMCSKIPNLESISVRFFLLRSKRQDYNSLKNKK